METKMDYSRLLAGYESIILDFSALFAPMDDDLAEALAGCGRLLVSSSFSCACEQVFRIAPTRTRETYRKNRERLEGKFVPFEGEFRRDDTLSLLSGLSLTSASTLVAEANYSLEDRLVYSGLPVDVLSLFRGGRLIRHTEFPGEQKTRTLDTSRTPLPFFRVGEGSVLYAETTPVELGKRRTGGAEAEIYEVQDKPRLLAKLYAEDVEDGKSVLTMEKLQNILSLADVNRRWRLPWLALPENVLYADKECRQPVGYTMRRFENASFLSDNPLFNGGSIGRILDGNETVCVRDVLSLCIRLTRQILFLTLNDIHLSDYNDRNFAQPSGRQTYLLMVDTDSYCSERYLGDCITYAGRFSRSYVPGRRPDMLDLCDESLYSFVFTRLVLDSTFAPIRGGTFRFSEEKLESIRNPNLLAKWESIPPNLQILFRNVFGGKQPPSLETLLFELEKARKNTAFSKRTYLSFYSGLLEQLHAAEKTEAAPAPAEPPAVSPAGASAANARQASSSSGTGTAPGPSSSSGTGTAPGPSSSSGTGTTRKPSSSSGAGSTRRSPPARRKKTRRGLRNFLAAALLILIAVAGYTWYEGLWSWDDLFRPQLTRYEANNGYYLSAAETLDGYAEYYWDVGDVYKGDFEDGTRTGTGTYTWACGDIYEGDFVNGERTGSGTYTWANGDVYEGGFTDGQLNGEGSIVWASGARYTGSWENGMMDGEGTYYFPNGQGYTPSEPWENGSCFDGNEVTITVDDDFYAQGYWKYNVFYGIYRDGEGEYSLPAK